MQKYSIFIGIDISKKWFDAALCIKGNLAKMPHRRFPQSQSGYQSFVEWLYAYTPKHSNKEQWICCMEHTGMYAIAFCEFLDQQALTYILENPLRIKRSLGLRRGKSDKADSMAIAEYAWRHRDELHRRRPLPNGLLLRVQSLLSLRSRLVRYRHGLQVASGELCLCTSSAISQAVNDQTDKVVDSINQTMKDVMKQIEQLIRSDADLAKLYDLLLSIIGVGKVIAPYLIVHTNGFTAFETPRQFSAHIGIAPFDQESGTSLNLPAEVSKIAAHKLKALLSTTAIVAMKHDPQIKAFFVKKQQQGKEEGWIYHAVKNKMVHRIFAVVKRGTPYVRLAY